MSMRTRSRPSIVCGRSTATVRRGGGGGPISYPTPQCRWGGETNPSPESQIQVGRQIYETNCMSCHGSDRKGNPPVVPGLVNLDLRKQEYRAMITEGRNAMPAFRMLRTQELAAL